MGYYVFCSIIKNGYTLLEEKKAVKKKMKLSVGSSIRDNFRTKFLKTSSILSFKFEGNKLKFNNISSKFKTLRAYGWYLNEEGKELPLEEGTSVGIGSFVNVKIDDIEILIKLEQISERKIYQEKLINKDRKKTKLHFYHQPSDVSFKYKAISFIGALLVVCLIIYELKGYEKNTNLYNLDQDIILRIISPDSVYFMPELAQFNLDRKHLIKNTLDYYISYAGVLLDMDKYIEDIRATILNSGKDIKDYVFSNTRQRYKKVYEDYNSRVQKTTQAFNQLQSESKVKYKVVLPVVVGESVEETTSRAILKEWVIHKSLLANLEKKRAFKKKSRNFFKEDYTYSYEDYPAKVEIPVAMKQSDEATESLGKISPFGQLSGENKMYGEASQLAARVETEQLKYLKSKLNPINTIIKIDADPDFDFLSYSSNIKILLDSNMDLVSAETKKIEDLKKAPPKPKIVHKGKLDSKIIERVVNEHKYEINLCYEKALRTQDDLSGQLVVGWIINQRGRPESIEVEKTNISNNNELIGCIKQRISSWTWPYPQGGTVKVSYPFNLNMQF